MLQVLQERPAVLDTSAGGEPHRRTSRRVKAAASVSSSLVLAALEIHKGRRGWTKVRLGSVRQHNKEKQARSHGRAARCTPHGHWGCAMSAELEVAGATRELCAECSELPSPRPST